MIKLNKTVSAVVCVYESNMRKKKCMFEVPAGQDKPIVSPVSCPESPSVSVSLHVAALVPAAAA